MYDKIISKFNDMRTEAKKDCDFDIANIDNSFNNTNSLIKWINKKTEWNNVYRSFEFQRKKMYKELYEFYCTDYPRKLSTKDEYALFIESDEKYNDMNQQALLVKEIISYCDSVIDSLKSRGFMIKNAIDWEKFKSGQ